MLRGRNARPLAPPRAGRRPGAWGGHKARGVPVGFNTVRKREWRWLRRVVITLLAVVAAAAVAYFLWARYHRITAISYAAPAIAAPAPPQGQWPVVPLAPVAAGPAAPKVVSEHLLAFEALKEQARQGDPVAQRKLAQAYQGCAEVNLPRRQFQANLELRSKYIDAPKERARLIQVALAREEACRWLDEGATVSPDVPDHWFLQATAQGDLVARLRYQMNRFGRPGKTASTELLQKVLASNDPEAVFTLGLMIPIGGWETGNPRQDEVLSGELAGFAWNIVGCRMGYACEPFGAYMDEVCLSMNGCTADGFEEYIRSNMVSGIDAEDLDWYIEQISDLMPAR